jgi:hypothetical protein
MKPKSGQPITAAWASKLIDQDQPTPRGAVKVSGGVQFAPKASRGGVKIIAENILEDLQPYSLIGLKHKATDPPEDGRAYLEATKDRCRYLVTNGPYTVPNSGLFEPIFIDLAPMRFRCVTGENWMPGMPCGRAAGDTRLTPREGGLILVKRPDSENFAYAMLDTIRVWDAFTVGELTAMVNPLTELGSGIVGFIDDDAVSDQRADVFNRDDFTVDDGTHVKVVFNERWQVVWHACEPDAAFQNQLENP